MSRKTAMSVVFVAAAASLGLYLSRGPWVAYREQKAKADNATKEMRKHEQEKVDLLTEKARIDTPQGREELARQRKWLKEGETPLDKGQ